MEYIEEVLTKSKRNNKADIVGSLVAGILFFIMFPSIIVFFKNSKFLGLMLIIGVFLIPGIGFLFGMKLGTKIFNLKKVKFNKTKLYKKLEKAGYLNEFIDTINKEINDINTIKYYDEFCGSGVLITKTWFVFINILYPEFVRTNDIIEMSDEISDKSKKFMSLKLKNDEYIRIDHFSVDEIGKEIKKKYPSIKIK